MFLTHFGLPLLGLRGGVQGWYKPGTWVTEQTGHMGNTFVKLATVGGGYGMEGDLCDGRAYEVH